MSISTRILQLCIKDKHAKVLCQVVCEIHQVWNHINKVSAKAVQPFHGKPHDLQKCTAGYSKCNDVCVGSGTVLNWCVLTPKSFKYSLGWVQRAKKKKWVKAIYTKRAKSTLDAGWIMLKTMLEYKTEHHRLAVGVSGV